jgi:hypothetical protein
MLCHELFAGFEKVRWDMGRDIPWASFESAQLTDEQAQTIKMNAITEWSALPATEMFLRDNQDDSDFSAFMSIGFYEEQKHALVPDVAWLEHWLDRQIHFDKACENKVVQSILAKLRTLYDRAIADTADLKRFRKELIARLPTVPSPAAA